MRSGTHLLIVSSLSLTLLISIFVSAALTDPNEEGCDSCHVGSRPEGEYQLELPDIVVLAPDNVSAGGSFQLLVRMAESEPYDLISPTASLDVSGLEGAGADRTHADLEWTGEYFEGLFRVRDVHEGGTLKVTISFTIHYDHPDPEDGDIGTYSVERSHVVDVPGEVSDDENRGDEDTPIPLTIALLSAAATGVILRRKRS
ncbi:MAG: hypothetical protein KAH57_09115 [Thermoplasmata archaeon]|nr:hypothetical protein [Thermoplasmata archaeon]